MNRFIICSIILLSISCSTKSQEVVKEIASAEVNLPLNPYETIAFKEPYSPHSPYHLDLKIEDIETTTKNLTLFITLRGDAHFVSPHEKRDFKGKFSMTLEESNLIETDGNLIEIPQSIEETDTHHYKDGTVNWVRENTTYKLPFNVLTDKDFEIPGLIRFTIEPRCTLEEIPIIVRQKSGQLTVSIAGGC